MIFFPSMYDDELFYSAIARYHIRSGNLFTQNTLIDLYNSPYMSLSIFLPGNMDVVIKNMTIGSTYTSEYIINNHTLFPFYTAFSTKSLTYKLFAKMKGEVSGNTYAQIGAISGKIKLNKYFKFCPKCLKEDIDKYGETYWHRIHQTPGVLVCPKHKILLQNSTVRSKLNRHGYLVDASEKNCIIKRNTEKSLYTDKEVDILYSIAKDIEYIYNNRIDKREVEWYQDNYINYLIRDNFASFNKYVNHKKLCDGINGYYGKLILENLNCNISNSDNNWLTRITQKNKFSDSTIHNILLIKFLNISLDSFLKSKYSYTLFKNGIGPCLNTKENHYMKYSSHISGIIYNCKRGTVAQEFTCQICNFKYAIKGNKSDIRNFTNQEYENLTNTLINTLKDNNLKICYSEKEYMKNNGINDNFENLKKKHREIWTNYQIKYPEKSKSEISRENIATYKWLFNHDLEWLNNNSPKIRKPKCDYGKVDWNLRDEETLKKLYVVVSNILTSKERPQRITLYKLSYECNLPYLTNKNLNKLPRTSKYLEDILETKEDAKLRKIKWAIKEIINSDIEKLGLYNVYVKAGIRCPSKLDKEKIIALIEEYRGTKNIIKV